MQTLASVAIADPRHVVEVTKIKRPPNGVEEVPVMLSRLVKAHELIIEELRDAIDKTAANQDNGTNDILASFEKFIAEVGKAMNGQITPVTSLSSENLNKILTTAPKYGIESIPPASE